MKLEGLPWPQELAARFGIAALVPVVSVGLLMLVVPRLTALPDGVAMRVADVDVSEQELRHRVDALGAMYGIAAPAQDDPARDRFDRETAKAVAVSIVVERAAQARGIVVPDKAAQDAVTQLIDKNFGAGGRPAFVRFLGEVGASMQNVVDEIKRQRSFAQLFDQVTKDVPEVTEADARAVYDTNPDRMATPEQRRLSNIVVAGEPEAEQIVQRARAGTDFAALAKEVSLDGSTRDSGGDLGFVDRDQLEAPYAEPAFTTPVGSLFGPVQTRSGWNVGRVTEVRPRTPVQFEIVQEQLRARLRGERKTQAWNDWLGRQLEEAEPDYADRYRPADPDGVPSVPPAQPGPGAPAGERR